MLFDPRHLLEAPGLTAATLGVVVVGKPVIAFAVVLLLRQPPKVGLGVSVALAQIGEFSFMLALLGRQLGVLPPAATDTLVAAAIVSIMLNPLLYRAIDPLAAKASRRSALWRWLERRAHSSRAVAMADPRLDGDAAPPLGNPRAIVVGYGPVGRTVTRLLAENEIRPTVVELNVDTVRELRKRGIGAVYGDAAQRETLRTAGIEAAGSLILSASATPGSAEIIRLARELNPEVRVLARTTYVRELHELRRAGAEAVVSSESEVAISLTVAILEQLGATPEQIDRERARVQDELFARNDGKPAERA
jgi:CPA2 family monovalent cation:H+ antiporter-2